MGAAGDQIPPAIGLLGTLPAIESTTKLMGLVASQVKAGMLQWSMGIRVGRLAST